MKKSKRFYQKYLGKYFDKHYSEYSLDAEFYNDPQPNQWKFDISAIDLRILLTCSDLGIVTEERREL